MRHITRLAPALRQRALHTSRILLTAENPTSADPATAPAAAAAAADAVPRPEEADAAAPTSRLTDKLAKPFTVRQSQREKVVGVSPKTYPIQSKSGQTTSSAGAGAVAPTPAPSQSATEGISLDLLLEESAVADAQDKKQEDKAKADKDKKKRERSAQSAGPRSGAAAGSEGKPGSERASGRDRSARPSRTSVNGPRQPREPREPREQRDPTERRDRAPRQPRDGSNAAQRTRGGPRSASDNNAGAGADASGAGKNKRRPRAARSDDTSDASLSTRSEPDNRPRGKQIQPEALPSTSYVALFGRESESLLSRGQGQSKGKSASSPILRQIRALSARLPTSPSPFDPASAGALETPAARLKAQARWTLAMNPTTSKAAQDAAGKVWDAFLK